MPSTSAMSYPPLVSLRTAAKALSAAATSFAVRESVADDRLAIVVQGDVGDIGRHGFFTVNDARSLNTRVCRVKDQPLTARPGHEPSVAGATVDGERGGARCDFRRARPHTKGGARRLW